MILDVNYDLKKILETLISSHVATELTKVVVAQKNDAGLRIFEDKISETYNDIYEKVKI